MKATQSVLVILLGLALLWLAATGKLDRLAGAWSVLRTGSANNDPSSSLPSLTLPQVLPFLVPAPSTPNGAAPATSSAAPTDRYGGRR